MPLDDDSVYISELIGCTVYDGSTAVGVIADVQFPATADGTRRLDEAAPLLEVTSADGEEILIPFAKAFVVGRGYEGEAGRYGSASGTAGCEPVAEDR